MALEELLVRGFKMAIHQILTKHLGLQNTKHEKIWNMGTFPMKGAQILFYFMHGMPEMVCIANQPGHPCLHREKGEK